MHRFYLPSANDREGLLTLEGREAHHALHVLRLQRGEPATVLDGAGNELVCAVESATKHALVLALREKRFTPPPPCAITLLVAIPKGKLIESIIQKAVELGVQTVVPLLTDRVITQLDSDDAEAKREKWQIVASEAMKQCGTPWLPHIQAPRTIADFHSSGERPELSLVGSLQTERRHPRAWIQAFEREHGRLPRSAGAWIGPEGDFTLAELQSIEAAGARPITLGALTLRVETAAIYCLSFLNYELQGEPPKG